MGGLLLIVARLAWGSSSESSSTSSSSVSVWPGLRLGADLSDVPMVMLT
jgi:hypothetical protein